MTSEIIIPRTGLDVWAKQHLTNLIQAKTQPEFDRAFDNFIAQNVTVEFNGQSLTRDQYKKKLQGSRPMRISANTVVNILNTVQVPTGGASVIQPSHGVVGLFYEAKIRELKAFHIHSSLNLDIKVQGLQGATLPSQADDLDISIFPDPRRVVKVNQVSSKLSTAINIGS